MASAANAAGSGVNTEERPPGSVREAQAELELAIAADATNDPATWGATVREATELMRQALQRHASKTEGTEGFHDEIVSVAPRLSGAVDSLVREHEQLSGEVNAIVAALDQEANTEHVALVRRRAAELITHLSRHDRRGADLLHEAYEHDIGGED